MLKRNLLNIPVFMISLFVLWQCAPRSQFLPVQEVNDPEHGLQSHIMTGNYLVMDSTGNGYSFCQINPGRIKPRNNRIYYVLNLIYHSQTARKKFDAQKQMVIDFDQDSLVLEPHDIRYGENEVVAFYEIDKFDLVDLANANTIKVMIGTGSPVLSGQFSDLNKYNIRYFTSRYVLNSTYEPEPPRPAPKAHWGFAGIGMGSGYEFWLAKYSSIFSAGAENENSDFLALGIGFSPFSYEVKGIRQFVIPDPENPADSIFVIRYWQDKITNRYIPAPGLIYGWSFKNIISNFSLEAGISARYHFLPDWQGETDSVYVPEKGEYYPSVKYVHSSGELFDGFSVGLYLQLGGVWARIDSKRSWAAGISLPVPWWK